MKYQGSVSGPGRRFCSNQNYSKIYAAAAIALLGLVFASQSWYSPHAAAQDRKIKFQQDLGQVFSSHEDISLDPRVIAERVRTSGRMSLATQFRQLDLELRPNDVRSPDYRAEEVGRDGITRSLARDGVSTYKGFVEGLWASDARFTITDNEIEGMVLTPDQSFYVEPARKYSAVARDTDYILYRASDVREDVSRTCGVTLEKEIKTGAQKIRTTAPNFEPKVFSPFRVVEMATEADFEYTNALGGSAAANNNILGVMNSIQAIYERDIGLTFTVVFQHTWTTADPFTTAGPSFPAANLLQSFTDYWNANFTAVARDDAHLWTGKNLGGPNGLAWTGTVCVDRGHSYGISDLETNAIFKVGIPAHEIAHNFNASHTDDPPGSHPECDNTIMVQTQTPSQTLTFCPFSINEITNFVNANSSCLSQAQAKTIQFNASAYSVGEGGGFVQITVMRSGDTSAAATVDYRTTDTDTFTVNCAAIQGTAFARCDFATVVGTLNFAAGETSRTFNVPIINDSYAEGNETFGVVLSNPTGGTLGSPSTATVTITDNETVNGPNPIFQTNAAGVSFFVRQHYLDFLGREPEPGEPWSAILNGCSDQFNTNPGSPAINCDRIFVSGSFFGSPEFKDKGFYVIGMYRVSFNRLPTYVEFSTDLASISGTTAAEVFAKRAAYANSFVGRPEFTGIYGAMTNTQFVNALMSGAQGQNYNLTSITTRDPASPDIGGKITLTTADLINRLTAGTMTRGQVLRAIAQSDEITLNKEAVNAFVASQYYGYLRRTPDTVGFNGWVTYLQNNPNDFRTMVNGFVNSPEYRSRFGPV